MKPSSISFFQIVRWGAVCSFLILSTLLLSACGEPSEEETIEVIRPVKLFTVSSEDNLFTLEYPGVIAATKSVELGFEVQGKITELPIIEGQKVTEGEVLAKLDPTDYIAARDGARSNHHALNSAYQRAKKIFDLGAGSQAEVDLTLRDVRVAREQLKSAQKALDDTVLVSPFEGEVARKMADNFQNIQAKQPILLLQDISSLEIDVTIPEKDFTQIDTTLTPEDRTAKVEPEVELSAIPGRRFPARFKSFSSAADPITRTYTVTMAFDNPADTTILPGMTGKAIITLSGEEGREIGLDGLLVPASSVAADEQGNAYVWVVRPESMQTIRVAVELGTMSGAEVRVLKGLKSGDQIAISGVHFLREGMKVRPLGDE